MAIYKLSYDKEISDELRIRFSSDIAFLENEGFKTSSLHQEIIYAFSLLTFFPVYVAMRLGGEIIKIEPPLRISSFHLTFSSQSHAAYAYAFGLGCKFYTNFTDGTWLVSNTGLDVKDQNVIVLKKDPADAIALTPIVWRRHQEKVSELEAQGKQRNHNLSFDAWAKLDQRFEQSSWSSILQVGVVWWVVVIGALYWLISTLAKLAS